ncbi:MAG: DUF123 domain-containing protein [Anaerolineae bacterium]|nr:DUF123 domain-containing protein [Anaerolineae bacterium]
MNETASVVVIGDEALGGAYLLRMRVMQAVWVRFGRFQGGEPILMPQGEMLYVGSALRGLASRVLRHARRSGDKPAHGLYAPLLAEMQAGGLVTSSFSPPARKQLHWHVDYLLDETAVSLSHVLLIRSQTRLEDELAVWLLAQKETAVLVPGLGASDAKGQTHLLSVQAEETWWQMLPRQIAACKS